MEVKLQAKGLNYVYNSLAAAAVGLHYKVKPEKIIRALEQYIPDSSSDYARMAIETKNGITLLNDTYNANPSSMQLAMETLSLIPRVTKKIAVLGDMRELGSNSIEEHIEILAFAASLADKVFLFGEQFHLASEKSQIEHFCHFESKDLLFDFLKEEITEGTAILVKGSRGLKMEEISVMIRSEFLV
jgi:UDP-N-acetylmuramyl pentapeptide synthase